MPSTPKQPHPQTLGPEHPALTNPRSSACTGDQFTALDGNGHSPSVFPSFTAFPGSIRVRTIEDLPRKVSLALENAGSVARDHLASERTFLAYVRTSLTIASSGVALAQLLTLSDRLKSQVFVPLKPFEVYARPLAATSILLALIVLFIGTSRYFAVQAALPKGMFPVVRIWIGIIALVLAGIISLLFGLLVAERRS
ncbi:hypothetical protein FB451DRAFT_1369664 [Mycena latifolia]|nr:hypothetical protein FB451DRAFT_1369664 [Mycena latifolia]